MKALRSRESSIPRGTRGRPRSRSVSVGYCDTGSTGKNVSRRPCTTSAGSASSGNRSRQRGLQLSLEKTGPIWLACGPRAPCPACGPTCVPRSRARRRVVAGDRRAHRRELRHGGTVRPVGHRLREQSAHRRRVVVGQVVVGRARATGRVQARVSAENASGYSSAATWATIPPTPRPARCAGWPSSARAIAAASAARSRRGDGFRFRDRRRLRRHLRGRRSGGGSERCLLRRPGSRVQCPLCQCGRGRRGGAGGRGRRGAAARGHPRRLRRLLCAALKRALSSGPRATSDHQDRKHADERRVHAASGRIRHPRPGC